MQKNLKTIGAYTESSVLIFKAFNKIIRLVTLSLKLRFQPCIYHDFIYFILTNYVKMYSI
jgi:hypothetical protein